MPGLETAPLRSSPEMRTCIPVSLLETESAPRAEPREVLSRMEITDHVSVLFDNSVMQ